MRHHCRTSAMLFILIIVSVYSGAAAAAAAPQHWPHSVIITVFNYFLLTAGCWCRGQDTRLLRVPVMTRHRSQITPQQPRTHTHYTQLRGCVKYKHEHALLPAHYGGDKRLGWLVVTMVTPHLWQPPPGPGHHQPRHRPRAFRYYQVSHA